MSRNTWWKPEKSKVKVVFRLQFHATHIPQTGWNNLFISFIRSGSSKATSKTHKANVRNGNCKWADPIYETTELLQDPKTYQYDEKLYKLVVAKGTSRSSLLGEANISLSGYLDASSPTIVALPLHGSDSGAILHVAVQLLTSKTGFREFEQQVSDGGVPANTDYNGGIISTLGEAVVSHGDKANPRAIFKPEPKVFPSPEVELGGIYGYANTSGSLYAEKHDNSSTRKIDSIKKKTSGDLSEVSSSRSPILENGQLDHCFPMHSSTIVDREMAIVQRENSRLQRDLEAANLSVHELRKDIVSLQNLADDLSFQAQKLTEQMTVEMSSEKNLANDVSLLKEECLRFKHDLERVGNLKMNIPVPCTVLQNTSLGWLKGLQNMEEKICKLQKKIYRLDGGKKLMSLNSDIEGLYKVLIDLKRETENSTVQRGQIPPGRATTSTKTDEVMSDTSVTGFLDGSNLMQRRFFKLLREMHESKTEQGNLVRKMDQMECYYEALIHDLGKNQKQIVEELQSLRNEHKSCIYTVSSTNSQMDNEVLQSAEEGNILDVVNKELQRKAATSELALKRVSTNYSVAVNQLQKDLEVLSSQIHSMYESNETNETQGTHVDQSLNVKSRNVLKYDQDIKSLVASQEEMYRKVQEELSEMYLANVNLDVLSVILHETLLEAALVNSTEIRELVELLELSCKSNQSLRRKLKNISDEVDTLNNDLDAKLRSVTDENVVLRERIVELESLTVEYRNYKSKYESCDAEKAKLTNELEQVVNEASSYQLLEMHVVQTVVVKQHEFHVEELLRELEYFHKNLEEADKTTLELASRLSNCVADKENYAAENARLLSDLESLESNLEYNVAWSRALKHSNSSMAAELEMFMDRCEILEARYVDDANNKFEIEKLDCLLKNSQSEIEDLIFSKEELEIRFLVLQSKLSEQILMMEREGSSFASHESLRIVLLKDYYETKLHEIYHELSISEKHGEEMLLKLQDALDDLESRKKCEALQLKRNEGLMLKIAELESELQMAFSENREKFVAYEQLKAEFDCSVLSLKICKEEINMLSVSLQECTDCKCELENEVELMREQLVYLVENSVLSTSCCNAEALEERFSINYSNDQANHLADTINPQAAQEASVNKATEELSGLRNSENDVMHNLNPRKDQLKPQFLLSVIERLQNELEQMRSENTVILRDEKMRSENTVILRDENPDEVVDEESQRNRVHLKRVSEDIEDKSSLYNDSSRSRNSFGERAFLGVRSG